MIPLVSILIAVFAGWCLTRNLTFTVLGRAPALFRGIWFWVMRLVLPLVVAYIGVQYTAVSLVAMCNTGSTAVWCGPAEAVAKEAVRPQGSGEESPETPDEESDPAAEDAEPHIPRVTANRMAQMARKVVPTRTRSFIIVSEQG